MGWFSGSRKLPFSDLDNILRDIPGLPLREQEYVRGLFSQHRAGGISRREIRRAIRELKRHGSDAIGRSEANRIADALFSALGPDEEA